MANITTDNLKAIVQSVIASATRHKPNLSVTDPDDPRFVVGAEVVAKNVQKAQATADKAQATAESAKTTAESAKTTATTANNTANSALNTANSASSKATTANNTANSALSTANTAKSTATTANDTANTALSTANTAKSTAESAKTTAESAKTTAEGAKSTADVASRTAGNAQVSANNAYQISVDAYVSAQNYAVVNNWTQSNLTTGCFVTSYLGGKWIASSYGNDNSGLGLYYSDDGMEWQQSNVTAGTYGYVAYGAGIWVANSKPNGLWYSEDAKVWKQSNVTSGGVDVMYEGGTWVAAASRGGVLYSNDGKTWTEVPNMNCLVNNIVYADGLWVIATGVGIYWSMYADVWHQCTYDGTNDPGEQKQVYYNSGRWFASSGRNTYYSLDGKVWKISEAPVSGVTGFCRLPSNGDMLVAAFSSEEDIGVYISKDGKAWDTSSYGLSMSKFMSMCADDDMAILGGWDNNGVYYFNKAEGEGASTSPQWRQSNLASGYFYTSMSEDMWVASSGNGHGIYYATSTNKIATGDEIEKVRLDVDKAQQSVTEVRAVLSELKDAMEAVAEKDYELIEEITLDGLTSVSRSQGPDGAPYAFSDILIEYSISDQAEAAGHTYTTVYSGSVTLCSYGVGNAIAEASERYSAVGVNIANGAAVTFATDPGMTPNSLTAMKRKPETAIGVGNITSVSISTNVTFPAGSKLTIKAVKS